MYDITVSLDNNIIIHIIILIFMLISLIIALRSKGVYKSIIGITGLMLIAYGILWHGMLINNELSASTLYVLIALDSIFAISGLALIIIGISLLFQKEKDI